MVNQCVICGESTSFKIFIEHGDSVCSKHGLMFKGFLMAKSVKVEDIEKANSEKQLWALFKKKCKEFRL